MIDDSKTRVTDASQAPNPAIIEPSAPAPTGLAVRATSLATLATLLAACGGGGGGDVASAPPPGAVVPPAVPPVSSVVPLDPALWPGAGGLPPAKPAADQRASPQDAARFLTQSTFGLGQEADIASLQDKGYALWLWEQFNQAPRLHVSYVDVQKERNKDQQGVGRPKEEMSYEAVWQQWLYEDGQLRARVAFALSQIVVISNVAPDIRPYAMSSYMDMLNKNAFGNYRQLLRNVALHPAMGYYLNMINSEKADPATGARPNENFAREVLQLFSIGLVQLNADGSPQLDASGRPLPSYDESVVQGFARAFTGWSYPNATGWDQADEESKEAWTEPMKPFTAQHEAGTKKLLNGTTLSGGQSPEKDVSDALDNIFNHPNVGPFIGRQLIQRLVTSNPSRAYVGRVAAVFGDNGQGSRGDLRALVAAVLLDPEARSEPTANFGKQREPVVRLANFLRATAAKADNGINAIHYLENADNGLGQSPLLSPSVFNFFSPNFRPAGPIAQAGLVAPEFQITTETTVVGGLNFFASLVRNRGYGYAESKLNMDFSPWDALAGDVDALISRLNAMFFNHQMTAPTTARFKRMLEAIVATDADGRHLRVESAFILASLSPEYIIQR